MWDPVGAGERYKVYRGASDVSCPGTPIATVPETSFDDEDVTPGVTYWYSIKASNSCGDSDCSTTDRGERAESVFCYRDADGDGYGDPQVTTQDCEQPDGYVSNADDPMIATRRRYRGTNPVRPRRQRRRRSSRRCPTVGSLRDDGRCSVHGRRRRP